MAQALEHKAGMAKIAERAAALAAITGGKVEWYGTRKALTRAEGVAGVVWDGVSRRYIPAGAVRPFNSRNGSWFVPVHGSRCAVALSAAECKARGLRPGPMNYGDSVC